MNAIVKSIVSGDTLVIKPDNENEFKIYLNYIIAPKLARPLSDTNAPDQPYAFETREYLRKKLVGQEICYTIDFRIPENNRLMCTVYLGKDKETGENIIESLLSEGLVELRHQTDTHVCDAKYQRLILINSQAKINKRGRYSDELPDNHIRNIKWTLDNPKQFVDKHKLLLPLDGIVEFIRDGNTVRCLLLPSYYLVTIQLTGIKCPMFRREKNSINEPFAEEAKQYVEKRLLQRQVKILLDGVNKQNLVGTLLHPNGNIALHLLKEGLARCVDWSLTLLKQDRREKYRAAEKFAKDNRLKMWHNYIPQPRLSDNQKFNDPSLKDYQAEVLEVVNGDALIIRDLHDNNIRKIYLSSVRAPRSADFQQIKRPLYEIPYLFEAHELLRKSLIGKTVRVITDYIQPANNDYSEKIFCTVYTENINIGEVLIAKGLAKATRHRHDDEQRSSHYDDLLIAEQQAEKHAIGLFSTGNGLPRIVDMTGDRNKERAKSLLSLLQHNGRMEGVIEFVVSGSRFRVYLLKDNWIISLFLSSINCPRVERRIPVNSNLQQQKVKSGEPFGTEALNFSKEHFLQRDIFVEVENIDRGGNFIGRLTTTNGQSIALMLVQAGLAKIHDSVYNAVNYKQLLSAEKNCRKECIGIWSISEEPLVENNEEENICEDELEIINFNEPRFRRVVIVYITLELKIFIQDSEKTKEFIQLQNKLREFFNENKPTGEHRPKRGELLAVNSTINNEWYRARVEKVEKNNHISLYFVDYGNREVITDLTRIATLPSCFSELPIQTYEYELAYVRPPSDENDGQYIKNILINEIDNDECLIKVEYRKNNMEFISLYRANTKENLVKNLAEQGLIVINNDHQKCSTSVYEEYHQAQAIAKLSHRGLWQYFDQIEVDANE